MSSTTDGEDDSDKKQQARRERRKRKKKRRRERNKAAREETIKRVKAAEEQAEAAEREAKAAREAAEREVKAIRKAAEREVKAAIKAAREAAEREKAAREAAREAAEREKAAKEAAREAAEREKAAKEAAEREVKAPREAAEREAKAAEEMPRQQREAEEQTRWNRHVQFQLENGTYFATFDEVWDAIAVPFTDSDYEAMVRKKYPTYYGIDRTKKKWKSFFDKTKKYAKKSLFEVATTGSRAGSRLSLTPSIKSTIWPIVVLQSKFYHCNETSKFITLECLRSQRQPNHNVSNESRSVAVISTAGSEIAHLVPASPIISPLYHHVAIWVFGVQQNKRNDPSYVQKLIQGSRHRATDGERQPRISRTGLKYMYCNMVRLNSPGEFFDRNPNLIIVPILTLQQAKDWKGEGYHAIFMISTGGCNKSNNDGILRAVAMGVQLMYSKECAIEEEINAAKELLTATVKWLAEALISKSDNSAGWVLALGKDESKKMLGDLQEPFASRLGDRTIKFPNKKAPRSQFGK